MNIQFPSSHTLVRLGQVGIDHKNLDYFPLIVGNYILGGGTLVSRLGAEVREKRGLTYGINSQFTPMPGEGPFIISLSTKNDQANKALQITEDTLNLFINKGPSKQELESAKQYLTGSFPLSLGSNKAIANLLLRMAFYHLPDSYLDTYIARINAVTVDEIKLAFKQQVNTDKLLLVRVGQS
jgi:zinc protease